jgi:methyl-accepting chemotaxis protein
MKRYGALILACLGALVLATGCARRLGDIDRARFERSTVDFGDGQGPRPYTGGLLPQAGARGEGICKFVLPFELADSFFPAGPCLVVGPSSFPYELYLNGRLLDRYGEAGDTDHVRKYPSGLIPLQLDDLRPKSEIVVLARVGSERSPLMDIAIADSREGSAYVFWRNFFMTQLVAGGFAIGCLIFVYFSVMYLLGKGRDRRFLWFALICVFFAIAYVNIVFNNQATSDTSLTKLGRVGFFLCVTFLSFYVMEATALLHRKRWIKALALAAAAAASVLVLAQDGYEATNSAFHLATFLLIVPNLAFSLALIVVAVARGGARPYAILCLGFAGAIAASLYDMGFDTRDAIPYFWTLSYGYLWLVVCVFLELAVKQERVSRTARSQADDLNEKNGILRSVFLHLRAGSETLSASTEELAVSTREISITGNQQAAAVKEIVATMEDADTHLARISEKSSSVHRDSQATARKAEEGLVNVKAALEKLEAVIGRISESISMISEFDEQLGSIRDIVRIIDGIATQIRIIAFNASLEAVAAGEAGKNFGIVAEEVKRLADSTMSSVKSVRERVGALVSKSDEVVKVARQGYVSLEQSWDLASGIGDSFSGIVEGAESSARATADIDLSIHEETTAFQQIVQALKEISGGVNNFVDSATNTSETTHRLNEVAEQLHGLIVRYSGEDGAEGRAAGSGA